MPQSSARVLDRLTGLHPKVIDLSLERIVRLLDRLGQPQEALPPVVHVAGTNGKGSLLAFLRAMLEAAGLRVHVYTSPHLVRFSERIVIAGREIDDTHLAAILEECEAADAGAPITFFEITTAAAFLAFARTPADIVLLETGLGGRLDATNVIRQPVLTAITPVSLDHQSFLGETLAEIAAEKAGILKPGVVCVLAAQKFEAAAVIRTRAAAVGAPLIEQGRDWSITADRPGGFHYRDDAGTLALPKPGLTGGHQQHNAGLAVACAMQLSAILPLDHRAIARGIEAVRWPARLQRLDFGKLAALLPEGWELWLDGGHNPGAAAVLAQQLTHWRDRPLFVVCGMLRSKDASAFFALLAPMIIRLAAVSIPDEAASFTAAELAERAAHSGIEALPAAGVSDALMRFAGEADRPARVLICGSLYLAGRVLAENTEVKASSDAVTR